MFVILHPGSDKPIIGEFEELMEKYFEGFNLPIKYVAEPFDEDMEANICGWKITMQIEAINPNNIC